MKSLLSSIDFFSSKFLPVYSRLNYRHVSYILFGYVYPLRYRNCFFLLYKSPKHVFHETGYPHDIRADNAATGTTLMWICDVIRSTLKSIFKC